MSEDPESISLEARALDFERRHPEANRNPYRVASWGAAQAEITKNEKHETEQIKCPESK